MKRAPDRMLPKDALNALRLLRAAETDQLADSLRQLLADPRAAEVSRDALHYMRGLLLDGDAPGLGLAGEAVAGLDDLATVRGSMRTLASQLLASLCRANAGTRRRPLHRRRGRCD